MDTVVLDIDQTLLLSEHCSPSVCRRARRAAQKLELESPGLKIDPIVGGKVCSERSLHVTLRPGLFAFLKALRRHRLDVVLWSAGSASYVGTVYRQILLPILERAGWRRGVRVYTAEDCKGSLLRYGVSKSLRYIDLHHNAVLVDDRRENILPSGPARPLVSHGRFLPITSFQGGPNDLGLRRALAALVKRPRQTPKKRAHA